MPTTRKKAIKTVYKNDDSEEETGDFSDSGSDAKISEESSSEDDEAGGDVSSGNEFQNYKKKSYKPNVKPKVQKKPKPFAKTFINKLNKTASTEHDDGNGDEQAPLFSVKDLTDADKLLPPVLNLSESDSSDDESPKTPVKEKTAPSAFFVCEESDSEKESNVEYKDVFSNNLQDNSEEIAKNKFLELEMHKTKIEEAKVSIESYTIRQDLNRECDVKDLLAQGEEVIESSTPVKKKVKRRKAREDSDSDMEDWEEVKEGTSIPQQGLQLVVDLPDAVCRKTKKIDVEMMMKRKINRVKKEYQVYMHKVHVLCWLGHGNYVSHVLNDQEVMAAALALVPSKDCYPGERVDMKYLEQITTWYKDKISLKQDKNEDKFRPKAPPLKDNLKFQMKNRVVTTKKYMVLIFVAMLRALGLQCRVMFNFVTLPLKPPTSELCSLSIKPKDEKKPSNSTPANFSKTAIKAEEKSNEKSKKKTSSSKSKSNTKISQVDGNFDCSGDSDFENIIQLDGSNDVLSTQKRTTRVNKTKNTVSNEDVSPPKRSRYSLSLKTATKIDEINSNNVNNATSAQKGSNELSPKMANNFSPRKTRSKDTINVVKDNVLKKKSVSKNSSKKSNSDIPKIVITSDEKDASSKYFESEKKSVINSSSLRLSRKRSQTATPSTSQNSFVSDEKPKETKKNLRTKSAPGKSAEKSKYFNNTETEIENKKPKLNNIKTKNTKQNVLEDKERVSHRDLAKAKIKSKNDVTGDLVNIIKKRVKEAKENSKNRIVKGKFKKESDEDSDFLPEEQAKGTKSDSDDDFKPKKISPRPTTSRKPSTSRKIDRRVLSSDEEAPKNKSDVWCEVYVEELEQWISVDVITGKLHCPEHIYARATHPMCYVVGWDNNNYLKDVTRRYVPHWNTVTRKQRAEPVWWNKSLQPWLGPKTARDREEDQGLDKMQLEAPLPKSIAEYKNHPLYALKRHLLKFEAIYPSDAATLGFVRGEPVYARECIYTCRSRDTWLKEAKVVRLGEQPYKVVKARPKWDKLSNKLITDKPLEVFGPWQVQDYEPPVAENGIVPRNAYGNVELFKDCMLPKGTVHIKLPGLNKVAKKLNIDCAPAMTGFDFNGGWSHPVYDGFVVCKEFGEIITEAWLKDQEEQERREREKTEARVYGNWRRLIKGLFIRERLKCKYGFEDPSPSQDNKKSKGPRLVVKKK